MITGGKADESVEGKHRQAFSSQPAVRSCTALSPGSAYFGTRSLDLKRERPRSHVTGVGLKPFRVLQKVGKGLEFNNLARRLASFCQFESSKVE
jgi:hypothetical protein